MNKHQLRTLILISLSLPLSVGLALLTFGMDKMSSINGITNFALAVFLLIFSLLCIESIRRINRTNENYENIIANIIINSLPLSAYENLNEEQEFEEDFLDIEHGHVNIINDQSNHTELNL